MANTKFSDILRVNHSNKHHNPEIIHGKQLERIPVMESQLSSAGLDLLPASIATGITQKGQLQVF